MGALDDTIRPRTLPEIGAEFSFEAGYPTVASVLAMNGWVVICEPAGFEASDALMLEALSRGTEAVSVLRHDYAADRFVYAKAGTLVTQFDPRRPSYRWGAQPDALLPAMRTAGLDPDQANGEHHAIVSALLLAGLITHVMPSPDALTGTLVSAHIEPWFSDVPPSEARHLNDPKLIEAIRAASPQLRRTVAVKEVRRLGALSGVGDNPGFVQALSAIEHGRPVTVSSSSTLGRDVRGWLADSRRAGSSLNDPAARSKMSESDRERAFRLGWLAAAFRSARSNDSQMAVQGALRPLTIGPVPLHDPARRSAVLSVLRQDTSPDLL
jgi:hypothetical protein